MVILGLGSNIEDRLSHLQSAYLALKKIPGVYVLRVSPVYVSDALLPDNAPPEWDKPYLNCAIQIECDLTPILLLDHLKRIEAEHSRNAAYHWGPRPIDIDILCWNEEIIQTDRLHIPHEDLEKRPFALWPLADLAPRWINPLLQGQTAAEIVLSFGSRFSGEAPFRTRQIPHRIDTPQLMGIINLTPDSSTEKSPSIDPELALQKARDLTENGAQILDIGAESTSPNAIPIDAETEWQRLLPALRLILDARSSWTITPKISIDTRHVAVAERALALGVDIINDVSGLEDPAMRLLLAHHTQDIVLMYQRGIPANHHGTIPAHLDPVKVVYEWLEQRIALVEASGILRSRIIADIGIGFGQTASQSTEILRKIDIFKSLNTRILLGHSRKFFLSLITPLEKPERDIETLAISLQLSPHVDILRLHNIEAVARAFKAWQMAI